jgi:hypothetical protein
MVAEEMGMVNFSPITSRQGGQVLDYQKQSQWQNISIRSTSHRFHGTPSPPAYRPAV